MVEGAENKHLGREVYCGGVGFSWWELSKFLASRSRPVLFSYAKSLATFKMIHIPISKILKAFFQKHSCGSLLWKDVKIFAKFTAKHLCESLFLIKLEAWGLQLYFKNTPAHCCFHVHFEKFLKAPIL